MIPQVPIGDAFWRAKRFGTWAHPDHLSYCIKGVQRFRPRPAFYDRAASGFSPMYCYNQAPPLLASGHLKECRNGPMLIIVTFFALHVLSMSPKTSVEKGSGRWGQAELYSPD